MNMPFGEWGLCSAWQLFECAMPSILSSNQAKAGPTLVVVVVVLVIKAPVVKLRFNFRKRSPDK